MIAFSTGVDAAADELVKDGVASGNPFESKLYGWLRELVKLRDVFMADPATAKLLAV